MRIRVEEVRKQFHDFVALDGVSLEIESGELVALLGPSGCGKTTLMRIIAGLEQPDSGSVSFDGASISGAPVRERGVGFVFQHYALFKHMSVFDNVAFGLTVRPRATRPSKAEIKDRVMKLLDLVHLGAFFDRYPSQLSGGQRQRVALARALAVEPRVLLLDEPFGALDAKVRQELRRWMRRLHDEMHITSVFVTHDQEEAMEVADRVVVMNRGRIEQIGSPESVYQHPANSFVYDFLDSYNVFDAWQDSSGALSLVPPHEASSPHASESEETAELRRVKVFARPYEIQLSKASDGTLPSAEGFLSARVLRSAPTGSFVKMELERNDGEPLHVQVSRSVVDKLSIQKGDAVWLRPTEMRLFP